MRTAATAVVSLCTRLANPTAVPADQACGMRLLLIDDDPLVVEMLRAFLGRQGFALDAAGSCREGRLLIDLNPYDLLIVDWNLPDLPGVALCHDLRQHGRSVPILLLTARREFHDQVRALDAGADDYLTKPFQFTVLAARLRALLRRGPAYFPPTLRAADVVLDTARRQAWRAGVLLRLTPKEYAVLEHFIRNRGRVVTRENLCTHVWDENHDPASRVLTVVVSSLRAKLAVSGGPKLIETLRGHGYLFAPLAEAAAQVQDSEPAGSVPGSSGEVRRDSVAAVDRRSEAGSPPALTG